MAKHYIIVHNGRQMSLKSIENVMEKIKKDKIFIFFLFLGFFLVFFVFITLGDMFYRQINDLSALFNAAKDPVVLTAMWLSIAATTLSTLIAFIFGVPLAYILARKDFIFKTRQ